VKICKYCPPPYPPFRSSKWVVFGRKWEERFSHNFLEYKSQEGVGGVGSRGPGEPPELKAASSILALRTTRNQGFIGFLPVNPFSFPAPFPARKSAPRTAYGRVAWRSHSFPARFPAPSLALQHVGGAPVPLTLGYAGSLGLVLLGDKLVHRKNCWCCQSCFGVSL